MSVDTYLTTGRVAACAGASLRSDLITTTLGRLRCQHRSEPGQSTVPIAWPPPDRLRLQTLPHRSAGLQTRPPRPLAEGETSLSTCVRPDERWGGRGPASGEGADANRPATKARSF